MSENFAVSFAVINKVNVEENVLIIEFVPFYKAMA